MQVATRGYVLHWYVRKTACLWLCITSAGREFVELSHEEQVRTLRAAKACVFSRAEPKHKQVCAGVLLVAGGRVRPTSMPDDCKNLNLLIYRDGLVMVAVR
jgi:hypothetical protein